MNTYPGKLCPAGARYGLEARSLARFGFSRNQERPLRQTELPGVK
jgi:hypothetical protein